MHGFWRHQSLNGLLGIGVNGHHVRHGFKVVFADRAATKLTLAMGGAFAVPAVHWDFLERQTKVKERTQNMAFSARAHAAQGRF